MMLVADLERLQRALLVSSGVAGTPGTVEAFKLDPGVYELRCTDDIVLKIGVQGQSVTMRELQHFKLTEPLRFKLRTSKTLLLAATGTIDVDCWLVPLVEHDDAGGRR